MILIFSNYQQPDIDNKKEGSIIINPTPQKQKVLAAILRFHNGMRERNGDLAISA